MPNGQKAARAAAGKVFDSISKASSQNASSQNKDPLCSPVPRVSRRTGIEEDLSSRGIENFSPSITPEFNSTHRPVTRKRISIVDERDFPITEVKRSVPISIFSIPTNGKSEVSSSPNRIGASEGSPFKKVEKSSAPARDFLGAIGVATTQYYGRSSIIFNSQPKRISFSHHDHFARPIPQRHEHGAIGAVLESLQPQVVEPVPTMTQFEMLSRPNTKMPATVKKHVAMKKKEEVSDEKTSTTESLYYLEIMLYMPDIKHPGCGHMAIKLCSGETLSLWPDSKIPLVGVVKGFSVPAQNHTELQDLQAEMRNPVCYRLALS